MNPVAQFLTRFRFLPGPVVAVELMTTGRRPWNYVLRFLYASALLLAVYASYPHGYYGEAITVNLISNSLHMFFAYFGFMQILAVVAMGPAMAAGTIASERERRTIEYLFVSTLNDAEIILGKLTARLLGILYLILAGVPVLATAMLLGGIAPQSLALLFVITFSTAIFVAVVSVTISAFSKRARDAVMKTYLVLLVFMMAAPLGWGVAAHYYYVPGVTAIYGFVSDANPFTAFTRVVEPNYGNANLDLWSIALCLVKDQAIVAAALLFFSALTMRRFHLRQSGEVTKKSRRRFRLFSGRLGDRPMLWKELWAEPAARWGFVGYLALAIIYTTVLGISCYLFLYAVSRVDISFRNYEWREYVGIITAVATFISCGALLLIGARSACGLTSEKERDCWDSLISTPLEAREIVFAKMLGSVWALRSAVPLLLALWLPVCLLVPSTIIGLPFHCMTIVILAMFAAALGARISLGAKNSMRAMAATIAIMVFVGGGYLFCCAICVIGASGGGEEGILVLAGCVPFLIACPTLCNFDTPGNRELPLLIIAYIGGNIAYSVAAAVLYTSAVEQFDQVTGRTRRRVFPTAGDDFRGVQHENNVNQAAEAGSIDLSMGSVKPEIMP
jgi:ABC-type transport system involved in multi-copper enzyme maturation permease subunit